MVFELFMIMKSRFKLFCSIWDRFVRTSELKGEMWRRKYQEHYFVEQGYECLFIDMLRICRDTHHDGLKLDWLCSGVIISLLELL